LAIIALLISVWMPSLGRARAAARNTQCLSDEHRFGVAVAAYAGSNTDGIPRGSHQFEINWTTLVARIPGDRKSYPSCNEVPAGITEWMGVAGCWGYGVIYAYEA
jgi:hypothetical protein